MTRVDLRDKKRVALLSSSGCVHWAREAAAVQTRAAVARRFPATKVDARTAAWGCQRCGPTRSAGRASPPQPVPPFASTPHGPQDGGERARRPHCGQPLCPPGRGPPTGSPTRSPGHEGNAPSRVLAPRHSSRPQPFLPHSAPPHVPSGPRSWARVPGGDNGASHGRPHSWGGRAERPPRPPPLPLLRGGRPMKQPIQTLRSDASPIHSSRLPWEPAPCKSLAYGRPELLSPLSRRACQLCVRGPGVHAGPRG